MSGSYVERLAKYIITLLTLTAVLAVCWYFRSVIVYVIAAAVVALVGRPVYTFLSSVHIRKLKLPSWLASLLTILLIFSALGGVVRLVFPVISNIAKDISFANVDSLTQAISAPLAQFNRILVESFPSLGYDFKLENFVLEELQNIFNVSIFSSFVGSVASFAASLGVGLFATVFIAFFFIGNPHLFTNIVLAFTTDSAEEKTRESLVEIDRLISRYFVGLVTEVLGVSVLNFLGLLIFARMGFKYSIGIAFITGLLNIVPYVGPLIGGVIGVSLSLVIKYACATSFGLSVGFGAFVSILAGVFIFTQLIDNYVYQPLIYSNSIKAHPLEIFIVFLMAGQIGGMVGMLVAIPAYTVIRTFAIQFFGHSKAIRMLTGTNH